MTLHIGTASAEPGERDRGWLDVTDLPTGTPERLPVVCLNAPGEGPTCWVTAAIHGNEVTGLAVAQDLAAAVDPGDLAGELVILPVLNPAGLRRNARESYYHDDDPNRWFPDPGRDGDRPPRVQELVDERIFEAFTRTAPADYLLDLHTAMVGAVPFTIRDRVLYDDGDGSGNEEGENETGSRSDGNGGGRRTADDARVLAGEVAALAAAVDLPVITEYPAAEYAERDLQRSTAGAALNAAGVPALTLELGGHERVEEDVRAAGVAAVCRGLVHAGALAAVPDPVADADPGVSAPVEGPVRRFEGPRAPAAGVVRHRVEAGDRVEAGGAVADVTTPHGERIATVESDHGGYVLGRYGGATVYENDPVVSMAVHDEEGGLITSRDGEDG